MLSINFASPDDAGELLNLYAPYILKTPVTFEYELPSVHQFGDRILAIQEQYPYLVCRDDEKIVGYAYASKFHERAAYNWSVSTSVYVNETYHGKGVGKALYSAMLEICRLQGFRNAYACITYPNDKSIRFHEKMGFRLVGHFNSAGYKLGKWWDIVYMEYVLNAITEKPNEIINVRDIKYSFTI